jgi:hypothetical protein
MPSGRRPEGWSRASGCALVDDPDRVTERGPVDEPRVARAVSIERAAELAHDRAVALVVDEYALTDEWRTVAAGAAFDAGEPLIHPAP